MSERLLVSTKKGLFALRKGGAGWGVERVSFLGDTVTMSLADRRDGTLYAALNHGHFGVKLHRSSDGGVTWEACGVPEYPLDPGSDKPPKLDYIWSLEAGLADQPGRIWCGTVPGGLFTSTDRGASWQLVRGLWDHPSRPQWFGGGMDKPGVHSICVDPRDSRHVTVGVSCAGVWTTRDGGATWNNTSRGMWAAYMPPERKDDGEVQDPHRMVQCPANPDALWVQHHNGIFRSTDGAESWTDLGNVQPSNFGFAVAVHPRLPERAWFIPGIKDEKRIPVDGRLVVTRTRDGGPTIETLTRGLPQQQAYDVVYRHGLDIDESGERLAFGSTTGGVWTTDNQGDDWHPLEARLPPVFCVRFA